MVITWTSAVGRHADINSMAPMRSRYDRFLGRLCENARILIRWDGYICLCPKQNNGAPTEDVSSRMRT